MNKMKKLNSYGFSHDILAVFIVLIVAILGVGYLVASHADQLPQTNQISLSKNTHQWTGWTNTGLGATNKTPSVIESSSPDLFDIYYSVHVAPNPATLFHDLWNGTSWSEKAVIGGSQGDYQPATVSLENNIYLFSSNSVSGLNENIYNGQTWSGWSVVPNTGVASYVSTADINKNEFSLFAQKDAYQGTTKTAGIYQNIWNGSSWSGWQDLGGDGTQGITAIYSKSGEGYLFATNSSDEIQENIFKNNQWSGWQSLNSNSTAAPATVILGKDLYLFAREQNSSNYLNIWNGRSWSGWQDLGGTDYTPSDYEGILSGLTATIYQKNNIALFSVGANAQIYQDLFQ